MPSMFTGTSGYAYKEWKPAFYPEDLAQTKFLQYYVTRLNTVEINNTFYRFPSEKLLTGFRDTAPDGFVYAIKAPQKITHFGRLKGVEQLACDLVERCGMLDQKLGPLLFQLPPNMKRDDERLAHFLGALPKGPRYTFEFRHESWFDEVTFAALRTHNVALCISEGEKLDSPREVTGDFVYARLRKEAYTSEELAPWREWLHEQLVERDVFVYLKHDDTGKSPEHALNLLKD